MKKFTLIELLVVVAIMGILMSLLLPSVSQARKKVKLSVCLSNMRQVGLSLVIYTSENDGTLPGPVYSLTQGAYKDSDKTLSKELAIFAGFQEATNSSYDEEHINKLFLCPSFINSVSTSDPEYCVQFATFGSDPETNKRYFGYPSTSDDPMKITAVDESDETVALKEIDNFYWPGSYGGDVSTNIRHGFKGGKAMRTALYFDSHVKIKLEAATP
jgi:prepilin-type N-terminal cleavage/methylation domain-containing protein